MRILGIDPGTLRTGYGVIQIQSGRISPLHFGCISSTSKIPVYERFLKIYSQLREIIEQNRPDCCAIESLFYCKNPNTAFKLGEARGVALLAAAQHSLPIFEYEPRKIKQSVVGFGSAHKLQVKHMVVALLGLKNFKGPEDITDALAAAICHAHHAKMASRMSQEI